MVILKLAGRVLLVPLWFIISIIGAGVKLLVHMVAIAKKILGFGIMALLIGTVICYQDWLQAAWLILQRVTRSENSAYSSSVKRVLITRLRWGVLYLFMAVNLLSWVDFFKRRKPQKAGLGWQPQQDSHRTK